MSKLASFEGHQGRQADGGFLNTALEALRAFVDGIGCGRQLYRDYLRLSAMSDSELQDIGIGRADIYAAVAGMYLRVEQPFRARRKKRPESRLPIRPLDKR